MVATIAGIGVESVKYVQGNGTVRITYDQEDTSPSLAIIATLADILNTDPIDIAPLYESVDPEILDRIVERRNGATGDIHVVFTHEDHIITIHSYGVIEITPEHEQLAETHRNAGR